MSKGLDLIIIILFICFIVALSIFAIYQLLDLYPKYKGVKRQEEYNDEVNERLIHPEKYKKE